jgi:superoxide dismutase
MTQYALPDLRYDFGALEPHISGKILELHQDKHHGADVKGANDTLEQLDEARVGLQSLEPHLALDLLAEPRAEGRGPPGRGARCRDRA